MLTVVIPVYNVEAYLNKCIQSVLNQSYNDMEILLINDGSTDGSGKICRQYEAADTRIRYFEKENEGSGAARNLGIRLAKGEYITFLDADDWWDKNYGKKMMEYAEISDIVVCDLCYVDDVDGKRQEYVSRIRMPDRVVQLSDTDKDFINKGRTFLCGKIFRTNIFRKYNIWQPTMAINDIPIVPLLIALSEKICRIGEPLYFYLRTRDGNTISSTKALESFGTALEKMRDNFERFGLVDRYKTALKKMYYSQIRYAIRKAKTACKSGRITQQDYEIVKKYLFFVIETFWKDWPNPEGKRFQRSSDSDINQAISNILFEDNMLTEDEPFMYTVLEKNSASEEKTNMVENSGKVIEITKNTVLEGEELWWQMADDILFCL